MRSARSKPSSYDYQLAPERASLIAGLGIFEAKTRAGRTNRPARADYQIRRCAYRNSASKTLKDAVK